MENLHTRAEPLNTQETGPEYKGFTPEQEAWVGNLIDRSGLPSTNLTSVEFGPNQHGREDVLGSFNFGTQRLILHNSLTNLDNFPGAHTMAEVQNSTLWHELWHSFDPEFGRIDAWVKDKDALSSAQRQARTTGKETKTFLPENIRNEAEEAMRKANEFRNAVADQALETGIYFNGYHKYHARLLLQARKDFASGEISQEDLNKQEAIYRMETWAIIGQRRLKGRNDLTQKQTSQRIKLATRGQGKKYVDVLGGVDKVLVYHHGTSTEEVDRFIANLKSELKQGDSPLSSPDAYKKNNPFSLN